MKKVDTSKVWRGHHKPEKLEMKGFSSPQSTEPAKKEKVVIRKKRSKSLKVTKKPRNQETKKPRNQDIMLPCNQAIMQS